MWPNIGGSSPPRRVSNFSSPQERDLRGKQGGEHILGGTQHIYNRKEEEKPPGERGTTLWDRRAPRESPPRKHNLVGTPYTEAPVSS